MQKHANLVDLVKSFPTNIFLQNLASIQERTSPLKFAHLAENRSKVRYRTFQLRCEHPGKRLLLGLDLVKLLLERRLRGLELGALRTLLLDLPGAHENLEIRRTDLGVRIPLEN